MTRSSLALLFSPGSWPRRPPRRRPQPVTIRFAMTAGAIAA